MRSHSRIVLAESKVPEVILEKPDAEERPVVFLSHDWGVDELKRSNHARVCRVNLLLKDRGFETWLDEEKLDVNIIDQISEGIERSQMVLVFVTSQYYSKVNGNDSSDYCKLEFEYALRRRGRANMVACIMDPSMRNSREWEGPLGIGLGGSLYFDMVEDDSLEEMVDRLAENILARLAEPEGTQETLAPVTKVPIPQQVWVNPAKPKSAAEAVFFMIVAVAAAIFYAIESIPLFASEVLESLVSLWQSLVGFLS